MLCLVQRTAFQLLHPKQEYHFSGKATMSQYVFFCEDCKKEFTQHLHIADRDKSDVACPNCGSKHVNQLVSAFSAVTSKKT